tara:strand:- start:349 stop:747 length:399 start_codon:yes stop_codon:yes gene_type:complete
LKKLKNMMLVSVCAFFFGCASDPSSIPSQYVSEVQYQSYDCEQLAQEARRVNSRVGDLYRQTKELADNDAAQMGVGLILFWPALFFLEGGDGPQAAEYARLKGESEAIDRATIAKKCSSIPPKWTPPKKPES